MHNEIIERLKKFSDSIEWERLCCDILSKMGYRGIEPQSVGGKDGGKDAIIWNDSMGNIAAHFSLRKDWKKKLYEDLEKTKGKSYSKIIYCSNQLISGITKDKIREDVEKKYGVKIDLFDQERFRVEIENNRPDLLKKLGLLKEENQRLKELYIIKHNTDLKDFLQGWKSGLPLVSSVEDLPFEKNIPTFEILLRKSKINKLEKRRLFKDVKTHLPKVYETLPDDWVKYKKLLREYFYEYNNIVNSIKNEILEEGFSAESVYSKAINLLKKRQNWNYYKRQVSPNQYEMNYGISYGSSIVKNGFFLIKDTDEEVKKCEEQHKAFSDKIKSKYEADLEKLIEKERELNKHRKSLVEILENLEELPGFPNMQDCDIINQSFYK